MAVRAHRCVDQSAYGSSSGTHPDHSQRRGYPCAASSSARRWENRLCFYPYAEDEKGKWRYGLGVGLWIYQEDFGLFYEGIHRVYPLQLKGFEDFDPTGLNLIDQPEWKEIISHWTELAISNPSSAEMIQYVSQWTISTLSRVDMIVIQGNL